MEGLCREGQERGRCVDTLSTYHISSSLSSAQERTGQGNEKRGAFNRSKQHHLIDVLFKDGVYERRKTIETVSLAEN
jgi:hypothetical protein